MFTMLLYTFPAPQIHTHWLTLCMCWRQLLLQFWVSPHLSVKLISYQSISGTTTCFATQIKSLLTSWNEACPTASAQEQTQRDIYIQLLVIWSRPHQSNRARSLWAGCWQTNSDTSPRASQIRRNPIRLIPKPNSLAVITRLSTCWLRLVAASMNSEHHLLQCQRWLRRWHSWVLVPY